MAALDTLSELIDRHLPELGMNREDLARVLEVSPSTVSRWSTRMPGPETVRALATVLDQPYGVVLAAALRSGGYAATTADVLSGHRLTFVARDPACSQDDEDDDEPGAVFTDPERAKQWAHVREELDLRIADYGHGGTATGSAVIDGACTPAHVVVFRAAWEHRTDTVTVSEAGVFAEVPSGLDPHAAQVEALSETGRVFAVSACGLDADTVRQTVEVAVSQIRADGNLLGTQESTELGLAEYLMHSQMMHARAYREARRAEGSPASPAIDPEMRKRLEKIGPRLLNAPYRWGGGADSTTDAKPWRDPITTYPMQPLGSQDS
ncbi:MULTISPECIES: helix-turn-helix domain-containing protein [Mycolicibacter]|uniref:Helix-turn-helix transcriptional regulator n=2 Tax=Mycolicibacter TaxID=1073531 RepID=A0ABU5XMA2_9MYCO|nr:MULTISPECIES: helix-turn-helix transcriptional regulator [unclassified Mycolicibacter]MEB3023405.1 helix-turn-helix transcriptional regulator [Mycolicibacter sp. MYC098]MEB3033747.1 helix-turn-helix transcriptional regulator [Mycolicibacter sp. MYC340]